MAGQATRYCIDASSWLLENDRATNPTVDRSCCTKCAEEPLIVALYLKEGGGRRTDPLAGGDHASGRPLALAPMGARYVVGDGGVAPPVGRAGVAGDPAAVVEDLDCARRAAFARSTTRTARNRRVRMIAQMRLAWTGWSCPAWRSAPALHAELHDHRSCCRILTGSSIRI